MNNIKIFENDLPAEIDLSNEKLIAIDNEALGLVLGRDPLTLVHETLGVGTLRSKSVKGKRKDGTKYLPQWKWRATFRDAYYVCCLIWPWAHVKLEKIQQIIEHYAHVKMNGKVVNLEEYKQLMSLE